MYCGHHPHLIHRTLCYWSSIDIILNKNASAAELICITSTAAYARRNQIQGKKLTKWNFKFSAISSNCTGLKPYWCCGKILMWFTGTNWIKSVVWRQNGSSCKDKFICKDKLICENKLICGLANKTILANKLIINVGISMFARIRLSSQIARIVLSAKNTVSFPLVQD